MKIYIANESKQSIGGGWTFLRTFEKYGRKAGLEFVHKAEAPIGECDVYFISGATMVQREQVERAKAEGRKIVLRIDNIPRNSRNRNTGTSRLYDFAQLADLVVYQSQWAKDYIQPFVKKDGPVILNGADTDIFRPDGFAQPREGNAQFLFAQYNRDETKQWHQAWYEYVMKARENPKAHLWIIGNFSPEQQEYNFDFFMGEKFRYVGILDDPADMAEYYRSADIFLLPYFNDACSQTLIEIRNCCKVNALVMQNNSGGNREIMEAPLQELSAAYMVDRYIEEIKNAL